MYKMITAVLQSSFVPDDLHVHSPAPCASLPGMLTNCSHVIHPGVSFSGCCGSASLSKNVCRICRYKLRRQKSDSKLGCYTLHCVRYFGTAVANAGYLKLSVNFTRMIAIYQIHTQQYRQQATCILTSTPVAASFEPHYC